MNLQIDIGNSFLKWRLLDAGKVVSRGREIASDSLAMEGITEWSRIVSVSVSSVSAEEADCQLRAVLLDKLPSLTPFFAQSQVSLRGVVNAYKVPSQLGVDRWLAVVAGYAKYRESCFIVDCGSAITVDVVDSEGCHRGGYIIPGLTLMKQSLTDGTERVQFDNVVESDSKYGVTTTECVQAGVNFSLISIFELLHKRMEVEEIKRLIVTGGDGAYVASILSYVEYHPDLVLEGLTLAREVFDGS